MRRQKLSGRVRHGRSLLVVAAILASFGSWAAVAAPVTWLIPPASTDFEAGGNWVGGTAPVNDTTSSIATLSGVAPASQPMLSVDRSVYGIDIQTAPWTILSTGFPLPIPAYPGAAGYTLTLGVGGIDNSANSGTNNVGGVVSSAGFGKIRLGADSTWTIAGGGTLQINSAIYFGGNKLTVARGGTGTANLTMNTSFYNNKAEGSSSEFRIQDGVAVQIVPGLSAQIPDLTDLVVETGGRFWLNNRADVVGSLAGGGNVDLVTTGSTERLSFCVGTNDKTTVFSGQLTGGWTANDGAGFSVAFGKRGAGTLTLTGATPHTLMSTLHVYSGGLVLSDAAKFNNVNNLYPTASLFGGTLTLDNGTTPLNDRLGSSGGVSRPVLLTGGEFKIVGNTSTATTETIGVMTVGGNNANVTDRTTWLGWGGSSIVTIDSDGTRDVTVQGTTLSPAPSLVHYRGGTALVRGTNLGQGAGPGYAKIKFTVPPTISGIGTAQVTILPYLIGDNSKAGTGTDFVTYDANGLRLLNAGTEYDSTANSINSGANNVIVSNAQSIAGATAVSSLILASGGGVTSAGGQQTLTITSGALMSKVGNTGLSVDLAFATEAIFQTLGNLAVTGVVSGSGGFTKSGSGTLTLNTAATVTGGVTVNAGTLKLAGGNNTLPVQQLLMRGGMLDLNGTSQSFNDFGRVYTTPTNNTANIMQLNIESTHDGYIRNTGAGPATLTLSVSSPIAWLAGTSITARPFTGQIQDDINLVKLGNATLALLNDNGYTGTTTITGAGGLALSAPARLSGTSGVTLNFAPLSIDHVRGYEGAIDSLKDTAPITSNGGSIVYTGRPADTVSETIGVVTASCGQTTITVTLGGNIVGTTTLAMGGLNRNAGATVNFAGPSLGSAGPTPRATISGQSATTFMGGWATMNGAEFAKYSATLGLGVQPLSGADYDTGSETGWTYPACNAKPAPNSQTLSADRTINSLNLSGAAALTVNLSNYKLQLISGGLLCSGAVTHNINGGVLTAGASPGELLVYVNAGSTLSVGANITDNPLGGAVTLVKSGAGILTLSGANSFTGGMYLNAGTVNFNSANTFTGLLTVAPNATGIINFAEALDNTLNVSLMRADTLYGKLTVNQNETIASLMLDGLYQPASVYSTAIPGALGSYVTWGTNMTLTVQFSQAQIAVVPEPAALGLLLLGLPLVIRRRKA